MKIITRYYNYATQILTLFILSVIVNNNVRKPKNPKVKIPNKINQQKLSDNKFLTFGLIAYDRTKFVLFV